MTSKRLEHRDDDPNGRPNPEMERFEDLARKLVKVPKKELDEKRKAAASASRNGRRRRA
jgi:hypothetical protein